MTPELNAAMERLSPTQRRAAEFAEGACLVLAGPGVGKTTVLTTRIARILDESRNRNFRILALTFTTKAADEMRSRALFMKYALVNRPRISYGAPSTLKLEPHYPRYTGVLGDFSGDRN
jgi:DNA helicase II / ATP-dependent DNA helicase PcrA